MDPIQYEKIADKLMQFRGKLPKDSHLQTKLGKYATDNIKERIDQLLDAIDAYAGRDGQGLIR